MIKPDQYILTDGTNTYLYGRDRIGELGEEMWTYHLNDALGSLRQITGAEADVLFAQSYEPYGKVYECSGTGASNYGFSGELTDPSELVYLRARYYQPETGRFISRDTWGGNVYNPQSLNRWSYAAANPVMFVDPSGRKFLYEEDEEMYKEWVKEEHTTNYPDPDDYNSLDYESFEDIEFIGFDDVGALMYNYYTGLTLEQGVYYNEVTQCMVSHYGGEANCGLCGLIVLDAVLRILYPEIYAELDVAKMYEDIYVKIYGEIPNDGIDSARIADFYNDYFLQNGYPEAIGGDNDPLMQRKFYSVISTNADFKKFTSFEKYYDAVMPALENLLFEGGLVIAGTFIRDDRNGKVTGEVPFDEKGKILNNFIPHWVLVTGISANFEEGNENVSDEKNWIRIYNPYYHRTEYYSAKDFYASWYYYGENNSVVFPSFPNK